MSVDETIRYAIETTMKTMSVDEAIRFAIEMSYLAGQILAEKDGQISRVLDSWRADAGIKTESAALSRLASAADAFDVLREAVLLARKRLIDAGAVGEAH